jgi:gamma-glutamylcyclotransferase (GGCT)/AIG2-like uncharacterized protein YtfP
MHVFTYGTLMFPQVWEAVVGRKYVSIKGSATGYAIFCVRDAVFPGILAASEQDAVRGVVYLDVDQASLARLDLFEDDFYRRETLWIDCDDGERRAADAYVVPGDMRDILTDKTWRPEEFVASGGLDYFVRRFQGFNRIQQDD